jgi:tryptophanyl-tRNA synthetase
MGARKETTAMTVPTITLTGIQPTGELHLGNYAGAIKPLAQLAAQPGRETYVFVADLHALNSRPDPDQLRDRTRKMAAALLACGLDHDRVHLYRQSRVPAIAQITALLSNDTSKGTLNRAHAYKALVAANAAAGRDTDHGVNMGVFTYPVLMAADILAMRAQEVPVGADQAQHVEIAVELARAFARAYRPGALREPQAVVAQNGGVLPGLDGRKMSKSYGNAIAMREEPAEVTRKIRHMQTDPARVRRTDPGDPEKCPVWQLHKVYSNEETKAWVVAGCTSASIGCLDCKQPVIEAIIREQAPWRERAEQYLANPKRVHWIVEVGTERARTVARETMREVRDAMGLSY